MEEKQYYIYIRSTNEQVPVTKEEFDAYYKDIDLYRRTQQRHGRCVCPKSRQLMCDMDCLTCPYRRVGEIRYFDATMEIDDETADTYFDTLCSGEPLTEDIICELDLLKALYNELKNLAPDEYELCSTIMKNMSERKAADELGLARNTYAYRKKKVLEHLRQTLKKFL